MQRCAPEHSTSVSRRSGIFPSGARWRIDAPAQPNGIGLVFSPGYGVGPASEAPIAPTVEVANRLLNAGYTLAGATYPSAGWSVADGLVQQPELVALVRSSHPDITRVIGWGHSMGGLVTVGLIESSTPSIEAAFVLCGSLAGPVAMLDQAFDSAFVLQVLLGQDEPQLSDADDVVRAEAASRVMAAAAVTAEGRARIALGAAIGQLPTWAVLDTSRPRPTDPEAQAAQQRQVYLRSAFAPRSDIVARAGGNPSGNIGVDYAAQLAASGSDDLVRAMYLLSSADLDADLATLADAARMRADPSAVARLRTMLTPSGAIRGPVVTVWCTGDVAPTVSQARVFGDAVEAAGHTDQLRQFFVDRPGHVPSDGEIIAALDVLVSRIRTGTWPEVDASSAENDVRFISMVPPVFLRPDRLAA
jgi:hypothetical protein